MKTGEFRSAWGRFLSSQKSADDAPGGSSRSSVSFDGLLLRIGVVVVACHWCFGFAALLLRSNAHPLPLHIWAFMGLLVLLVWAAWDGFGAQPKPHGLRSYIAATIVLLAVVPAVTTHSFSFFIVASGSAYIFATCLPRRWPIPALGVWCCLYAVQRLTVETPMDAAANTAIAAIVALAATASLGVVSDMVRQVGQSHRVEMAAQETSARHAHTVALRKRHDVMLKDTILNSLLLAGRSDADSRSASLRLAQRAHEVSPSDAQHDLVDVDAQLQAHAQTRGLELDSSMLGTIVSPEQTEFLLVAAKAELDRIAATRPEQAVKAVGVFCGDAVFVTFEWHSRKGHSLTHRDVSAQLKSFQGLGGTVTRHDLGAGKWSSKLTWQRAHSDDSARGPVLPRSKFFILGALMGSVVILAFLAGIPMWLPHGAVASVALGLVAAGAFLASLGVRSFGRLEQCLLGGALLVVAVAGAWTLPVDQFGFAMRYWYLVALAPTFGLLGYRWPQSASFSVAAAAVTLSAVASILAGSFDMVAWMPVGPMLFVCALCGWLLYSAVTSTAERITAAQKRQVELWRDISQRDVQAQAHQFVTHEVRSLAGPALGRIAREQVSESSQHDSYLTGMSVKDHAALPGIVDKGLAVAIRAARVRGVDVQIWAPEDQRPMGDDIPRGCMVAALTEAQPGSTVSISYSALGDGVWSVGYRGSRTDQMSASLCSLRAQAGLTPKPVMSADEDSVLLTWQSESSTSAAGVLGLPEPVASGASPGGDAQ